MKHRDVTSFLPHFRPSFIARYRYLWNKVSPAFLALLGTSENKVFPSVPACIARYLWGRQHHRRSVQHCWLRPRLYLHHRPSGQPRRAVLLQQRLQAGPQQQQVVRGPRRVPGRRVQPIVREYSGQLRLHVLRGSRDGQRPAHVQPVSQSALRRRVSRGLLVQRPHAGLSPRHRLCLSEGLDRKWVPAWRGRVWGRPGCVRWGEAVLQHQRLLRLSLSARLRRGLAGSLHRWVAAWKGADLFAQARILGYSVFLGWAGGPGAGRGGGESFLYAEPVIWNSLPLSVRHLSLLSSLKSKIGKPTSSLQ